MNEVVLTREGFWVVDNAGRPVAGVFRARWEAQQEAARLNAIKGTPGQMRLDCDPQAEMAV